MPYNDKGTTITKQVDNILAKNVNWGKVYDIVLEYWKNNKLSSEDIEKMKPVDLLTKINAVVNLNGKITIKNPYQYFSPVVDHAPEIIDITETANPRSEND